MFSVSKSQLRIMAESGVDAYLDRVTARIRVDFPAELGELPSRILRLRVQAAFERFRVKDFQRKEYLHRLIVLELLFGPQFETKLPTTVRLFAFPPPREPCPSEAERFWAIYRAAEQLTCIDEQSTAAPTKVLAQGEVWR